MRFPWRVFVSLVGFGGVLGGRAFAYGCPFVPTSFVKTSAFFRPYSPQDCAFFRNEGVTEDSFLGSSSLSRNHPCTPLPYFFLSLSDLGFIFNAM